MYRTALIAISALAFVAVACTSETTIVSDRQEATGVTVSGEGSVFGVPDVAVLTLGVEANAASVGEARAQAAESMEAMLNALKEGGVEDDDIQTTRFSVQPRYDFSNDRQEIIGFTVSNIVTAKLRDIDTTGDLIDAAVTAGGDRARVDSLQFTIDDPSGLEDEARREAMAEARQKAETLADAGGVSLGAPRSITEGGGVTPVFFAGAELAQEDAARTPIEVGELEVRVQVTVVYGLEE
jgi:hypothetical protein